MKSEQSPIPGADVWLPSPVPVSEVVINEIKAQQQIPGSVDPTVNASALVVDFDAHGFGRATPSEYSGLNNEYYWISPDGFVGEELPGSSGLYTYGDLIDRAQATDASEADAALEGQAYPQLKTFLFATSGKFLARINNVNNFQYRLNPDCNDPESHDSAVALVKTVLDDQMLEVAYNRLQEVYKQIQAGAPLQRYTVEREIIISALFNALDSDSRKGLSR